jgi:hypothetical protein
MSVEPGKQMDEGWKPEQLENTRWVDYLGMSTGRYALRIDELINATAAFVLTRIT